MEMILFVGLPGSGKSTFYKNHFLILIFVSVMIYLEQRTVHRSY